MKAAAYSRHGADLICHPGSSRITGYPEVMSPDLGHPIHRLRICSSIRTEILSLTGCNDLSLTDQSADSCSRHRVLLRNSCEAQAGAAISDNGSAVDQAWLPGRTCLNKRD